MSYFSFMVQRATSLSNGTLAGKEAVGTAAARTLGGEAFDMEIWRHRSFFNLSIISTVAYST